MNIQYLKFRKSNPKHQELGYTDRDEILACLGITKEQDDQFFIDNNPYYKPESGATVQEVEEEANNDIWQQFFKLNKDQKHQIRCANCTNKLRFSHYNVEEHINNNTEYMIRCVTTGNTLFHPILPQ